MRGKRSPPRALKPLRVIARWDDKAGVWFAIGVDTIGMLAEAEEPENITGKLQDVFADLCEDDPQLQETYDRLEIVFIREVCAPLTRGA